jgi:hypothetical protein
MAGEICPRAAGWEARRAEFVLPLLVYGLHYSQRKTDPENALTISGADRFTGRGGTCRLHAIFMNQLCIIWGELAELSSTAACSTAVLGALGREHSVRRIVRYPLVHASRCPVRIDIGVVRRRVMQPYATIPATTS